MAVTAIVNTQVFNAIRKQIYPCHDPLMNSWTPLKELTV